MPRNATATASDIFSDTDIDPNDVLHPDDVGPERRTRENVIQFSKANYDTVSDVTDESGKLFRRKFLNTRHTVEARLRELRLVKKPIAAEERQLNDEKKRIDSLIIAAWDRGARTADNSIDVLTGDASQRWSKKHVERVAAALGTTYAKLVALADFGEITKVEQL